MTATHWANKYIGREWREDHACGHFIIDVLKNEFGIVAQLIDADVTSTTSCVRALADKSHPELSNWKDITGLSAPKSGDVIWMSKSKHPHHVGIWIETDGGKVLQSLEGIGVIAANLVDLKLHGWKIVTILRHRSMV